MSKFTLNYHLSFTPAVNEALVVGCTAGAFLFLLIAGTFVFIVLSVACHIDQKKRKLREMPPRPTVITEEAPLIPDNSHPRGLEWEPEQVCERLFLLQILICVFRMNTHIYYRHNMTAVQS